MQSTDYLFVLGHLDTEAHKQFRFAQPVFGKKTEAGDSLKDIIAAAKRVDRRTCDCAGLAAEESSLGSPSLPRARARTIESVQSIEPAPGAVD